MNKYKVGYYHTYWDKEVLVPIHSNTIIEAESHEEALEKSGYGKASSPLLEARYPVLELNKGILKIFSSVKVTTNKFVEVFVDGQ